MKPVLGESSGAANLHVKIEALALCLVFFLCIVSFAKGNSETFTVPPFQQVIRVIGLNNGDVVTGSIDVSGGSGNDVNFYVTDPNDNTILRYDRTSHSSFSFTASITGTYTLHFDNSFSIFSSKGVLLGYTIKTSVFGIPQDLFLIIVFMIIILVVVVAVAIVLGRRKPKQ